MTKIGGFMNYSLSCYYSTRLLKKLRTSNNKNILDLDLIDKAICWAKKYHGGQYRKSGEPFYTHPLEVAFMLSDYNSNTNMIIAGILHDIVEDTEVTVEMILDNFGWRIAEMVDRLTRNRPDGTELSVGEILNNSYLNKDWEVLLIKLIDRLHNMQTLGAKSPEKIKKTTNETLIFFIISSMYMGHKNLEQMLYKLCCENLAMDHIPIGNLKFNECDSYLDFSEKSHIHQIVSQVFQNVTSQI